MSRNSAHHFPGGGRSHPVQLNLDEVVGVPVASEEAAPGSAGLDGAMCSDDGTKSHPPDVVLRALVQLFPF